MSGKDLVFGLSMSNESLLQEYGEWTVGPLYRDG